MHRITNVNPGLIFGGIIFGRIFGLVYRELIFGDLYLGLYGISFQEHLNNNEINVKIGSQNKERIQILTNSSDYLYQENKQRASRNFCVLFLANEVKKE